jgi:tRNA(Ser,Leu) C12 N-acetylase TAN1
MNKYIEGFKKRAGISIIAGQLILVMVQLWKLDQPKVMICNPDLVNQNLVCVQR